MAPHGPFDPRRLAAAARIAPAVIAAGCILAYLIIGPVRVLHPFELEWMEGAMLDIVSRVLAGQPMYAEPSVDFVSFIYPPAFYYASAAVAIVTGTEFIALRLVSFLSALGVFVLLYRFVVRESGDRFAGLVATGLFAATFEIGGAWFDVGRVDSLFLVVLFGAMYVIRFHQGLRGHILGGALVALAFLTKQSGIVMAAPVLLYALYRDWRYGLVAGAVAAALMVSAVLAVDAVNDGWFLFYGFQLPRTYSVLASRVADFWRVDIVPPLAVAWVLGMAYFARGLPGSPRLFHIAMAAGFLAGSCISRGNPGGYFNVLIPAFLLASLLFGLGIATARAAVAAATPSDRNSGDIWLAGACTLQFALLAYNPLAHVPNRADVEAGRAFVQSISQVNGDVWIPYHGHLATMAGKRQFAHWMSISDILESGIDSVKVPLQASVDSAVANQRFAMVVLSNVPFGNSPNFSRTYDSAGVAVDDASAFWPLSGSRRRPVTRYVPKQPRD